jgi:hypothetical protein
MKYSDAEIALVIKLREEGLVGQRLYNRFHEVFPDRTYPAIRSKIEVLRERGAIR